jgi:hypothetical protein
MRLSTYVTLALFAVMPAALAQTPAAAPAENSQQSLMKTCNVEAGQKHLLGDPRKAFMSNCLSHHDAAPAAAATPAPAPAPAAAPAKPMTPQERMKSCNAQASSQKMKGDARKSFMSTCLKAS